MFYIVETSKQLEELDLYLSSEVFLHIITGNYNYHPCLTDATVVYIRDLKTRKGFVIPIDHPDGLPVELEEVEKLLKSRSKVYVLDGKKTLHFFQNIQTVDIRLLELYIEGKTTQTDEAIKAVQTYSTYQQKITQFNVGKIYPLVKHYENCENAGDLLIHAFTYKIPAGYDFYQNKTQRVFAYIESNGLQIQKLDFVATYKPLHLDFSIEGSQHYTQYNLYNSTSRPTNSFNSVNLTAIKKVSEYRNCIRPSNDYFVELDYDGYHLRLVADIVDFKLDETSAHIQIGQTYRAVDENDSEAYSSIKQVNLQAMYGKITEDMTKSEYFLKVKELIDKLWSQFCQQGYIEDPISKRRFNMSFEDTYPSKLFNYYIQSLETSRNVEVLYSIIRRLKSCKTKIALVTYDAITFDVSLEDGKDLLIDIQALMEGSGKFPVKVKWGKTLDFD